MPKKFLIWGAIAFVIFYIFTSPDGAAGVVRSALGSLGDLGDSFAQFLNGVFA